MAWAFILGIFVGFPMGILVQALWDDYSKPDTDWQRQQGPYT
jgi:hypothetical protein